MFQKGLAEEKETGNFKAFCFASKAKNEIMKYDSKIADTFNTCFCNMVIMLILNKTINSLQLL